MLFTFHPKRLILALKFSLGDLRVGVKSRSSQMCSERYFLMEGAAHLWLEHCAGSLTLVGAPLRLSLRFSSIPIPLRLVS